MVLNSDILNESYDVARDFRDRALAALRTLPATPTRARRSRTSPTTCWSAAA